MVLTKRSIKVHSVPARSADSLDKAFSALVQEYSGQQRPRIVLDCSKVWEMDIPMVQLLLSYLEEVMRSNGDVRLAALRPELVAELNRVGVSRLFEIYPTADSAVQSFHNRTSSMAPIARDVQTFEAEAEYAA